MSEFMVSLRTAKGAVEPLGRRKFKVAPAVGDVITADDNQGVEQAYAVIARLHPLDGASTAGDLYLRPLGKATDYRKRLK